MKFEVISSNKTNDSQISQDVIRHLGEYVVRKRDKAVGDEIEKYTSLKKEVSNIKGDIQNLKEELDTRKKTYRRLVILRRVLNKMNTLTEEGVVHGELLNKMKKLLSGDSILKKTTPQLLSLDEKLSMFIPEKTSNIAYT